MNIHKNARLTRHGRELIARQIESGQTPEAAARAAGVCPRTARKWHARFKAEGVEGLKDRSSRPHRLRQPTPAAIAAKIEVLRRQRFTGKHIAAEVDVSPATVSRILKRLGLSRIQALEPPSRCAATSGIIPASDPHRHQKLGHFERASVTASPETARREIRAGRLGVRPCLHR
jgi:transposase